MTDPTPAPESTVQKVEAVASTVAADTSSVVSKAKSVLGAAFPYVAGAAGGVAAEKLLGVVAFLHKYL